MSAAANTSLPRRSPIDAWLAAHADGWRVLEAMPQAERFQAGVPAGSAVSLTPCCWRRRFGLKGPAAESWLHAQGFEAPAGANSWLLARGVLVGRLATSEFLVEAIDRQAQGRVAFAGAALAAGRRPGGVYPVSRQDLVVRMQGPALNDVLVQVCGVNLAPLLAGAGSSGGPLVLTSMVGVSVVAVPLIREGAPSLTLWADPSFALYFWTTLLDVVADSGGGVVPDKHA